MTQYEQSWIAYPPAMPGTGGQAPWDGFVHRKDVHEVVWYP